MAIILKPKNAAQPAIVPEGTYKATLSNIKQFQNTFGDRIGFEFTLHGEKVEGMKVMRSTNPILATKSKLSEVVNGLIGRDLTHAEISQGIDLEQFIGKLCNVLVLNGKNKNGSTYSNVDRVFQAVA